MISLSPLILLLGPPILAMTLTIAAVKNAMPVFKRFRFMKSLMIYASLSMIFAGLYYWGVSKAPPPREHMEEVAPIFVTMIWIFLVPIVFGMGYGFFLRSKTVE